MNQIRICRILQGTTEHDGPQKPRTTSTPQGCIGSLDPCWTFISLWSISAEPIYSALKAQSIVHCEVCEAFILFLDPSFTPLPLAGLYEGLHYLDQFGTIQNLQGAFILKTSSCSGTIFWRFLQQTGSSTLLGTRSLPSVFWIQVLLFFHRLVSTTASIRFV